MLLEGGNAINLLLSIRKMNMKRTLLYSFRLCGYCLHNYIAFNWFASKTIRVKWLE